MTRHFLYLVLSILLSACSIFEPRDSSLSPLVQPSKIDWQQSQAALRELDTWRLIGKIGVRTPEDSLTAAINRWSQIGDSFSIELSSTFFGLGASKLYGNSNFLTIAESGEDPVSSSQPNKLIEAALGFPLPITHLSQWIKALPVTDQHYEITFNEQGLPATLKQQQWQLEFSKYSLAQGLPLPGKIKLQRDDTRIILAIKQWILP